LSSASQTAPWTILQVWIFGEALQPARIVTFALIWAGLLVYSWSGWQKYRQG